MIDGDASPFIHVPCTAFYFAHIDAAKMFQIVQIGDFDFFSGFSADLNSDHFCPSMITGMNTMK